MNNFIDVLAALSLAVLMFISGGSFGYVIGYRQALEVVCGDPAHHSTCQTKKQDFVSIEKKWQEVNGELELLYEWNRENRKKMKK